MQTTVTVGDDTPEDIRLEAEKALRKTGERPAPEGSADGVVLQALTRRR